MTLRERIETILIDNNVNPDKIGTIAGEIMALGKGKGLEIIHEIGPNGFHRLTLNEEKSEWTAPTDIIKLGDFIATTDAFINMLPQVGKVFPLKSKGEDGRGDFVTRSVQSLS